MQNLGVCILMGCSFWLFVRFVLHLSSLFSLISSTRLTLDCVSMMLLRSHAHAPARPHAHAQGTSGAIPTAEREQICAALIPAAMQVESERVNRQLVMCLDAATMLCTPEAVTAALGTVMAYLTTVLQSKAFHKAKPAVRCLKAVLRSYQTIGLCWDGAVDETGAPPSPAVILQLEGSFRQLIVSVLELMQLCTAQRLLEFRKLIAMVVLVYVEDESTAYLLSQLWGADPTHATNLCQTFVAIMEEPAPADAAQQVLFFKTKARLASAWSLILSNILPPADAPFSATLLQADAAMVRVSLAILDQDLPGLDSDRDSALFHAFEQCAVAVLTCIADTPTALQPHRQRSLAPHAEALLTRVFFRYLCISGADVAMIGVDPEEYANRSAEEFKHALTCPHGAQRMFDCDICASNLKYDAASTARSAAMAACRELIRLIPDAAVAGFLQFINVQLAKPIVGTEAEQIAALAQRGGALRAFAAVADRVCSVDTHGNPAAQESILTVIRTVLIPETKRTPAFEFAAHLRCISCTVLERFVEYLSKQSMLQDMATSIHAIMSCLCDQSEAVRVHALNSLKEMVKWRADLVPNMEAIAPDAMNWFASLLANEAQQQNSLEIMRALLIFLYKHGGKLGDVPPGHAHYCGCSTVLQEAGPVHDTATAAGTLKACQNPETHRLRFASILKSHSDLFTILSRRFHAVAAVAVNGTASGDQLTLFCLLIEVIHALLISAPKDMVEPSSTHAAMLPVLLPYATTVLDPRLLSVAARFDKLDADAVDIIAMLPISNTELWAALVERIFQTIEAGPQHAELLLPMVCEFLHNGNGRRYLFEGGGLARIQPIAQQCLLDGPSSLKCRAADLYRSAFLISARATYDGTGEMVWSHWRLAEAGATPAAASTQARGPLTASVFAAFCSVFQAYLATGSSSDPLVRTVCAMCCALYVDPRGCLTVLQQGVGGGTGTTVLTLFLQFWTSHDALIDPRRPLDLKICSLGLCAVIRVLLESSVPLGNVAELLKAAVTLTIKFKLAFSNDDDSNGFGSDDDDDDDEGWEEDEQGDPNDFGTGGSDGEWDDEDIAYGTDNDDALLHGHDVEYHPDLEDHVPEDPTRVLQHLLALLQQAGNTPAQMQILLGMASWQQLAAIFQAPP